MRERSHSNMSLDSEWLRPFVSASNDQSSIDNARFIDSQPVTPSSNRATPTYMATPTSQSLGSRPKNAFGMETLTEFDSPGVSPEKLAERVNKVSHTFDALAGGA